LSNTFVKDPHTVVKAGQVVKVKVLEVDEKRKRIALTMRLSDEAPKFGSKPEQKTPNRPKQGEVKGPQEDRRQAPPINNAMAMALAKLKQ
jgi:uncharacterized protein